MPRTNQENPNIVILSLKNAEGKPFYRAVSVADRSITHQAAILEAVFQFIKYDQNRPLETDTLYGTLCVAYVRACSIPMKDRDPAVKFAVRSSGILGRSVVAHDQPLEMVNSAVHVAEHFTLF